MIPQATRTLIFGLDSFDFSFARRLAAKGRMPWLSAQLQQGSFVATHGSTLQGSEWVNAACGVSAAHHGYLHTSQLRVGTYEEVETDARIVRAEPFYVPLSKAGVRTTVVDLPVDRPRPNKNLTQVIDWGTEFKLWRYATSSKDVDDFVDATCGLHPLTHYGATQTDHAAIRALNEKLVRGVALKGKLIRAFLRRDEAWGVVFAGFGEVHKGGHFFWQYQDPDHPNYAGPDHPLAPVLTELYQLLDAECAHICAEAGEDVNVVVIADRGMEANYRADHLVPRLLERWGLYAPSSDVTTSEGPPAVVAGAPDAQVEWMSQPESLSRRLKKHLPVSLRPLVRRLTGRERALWRDTRAFQVAEVGTSYLRVNLRGREPKGAVAPGEEYEALLEFLEREFKALVNPATGRSPVAEVVYPRRDYPGPLNDELPDIGIAWASEAPVHALESASIGRMEGFITEQRSGNHTPDGGLLVAGPRFRPGVTRDGDLREFAPTLLALHGVPIPPAYERTPMPELIA